MRASRLLRPSQGRDYRTFRSLRNVAAGCAAGALITFPMGAVLADASAYPTALPTEKTPNVVTLPAAYPPSWAFLNYAGDRIELRNVGNDTREVKAAIAARDSTTLLFPHDRAELYVADTAWSRGTHGNRTDFITIYDSTTLGILGEIILPTKRSLMPPMEGMFTFIDSEHKALIFNFTPASSLTMVDLIKRTVIGEIEIPGCSLAYSTGVRGFSTLCSNGTMLSVQLDTDGKVLAKSESAAFNVIDTDPLFTSSATIDGVRYFPTMLGHVRPIDLKGVTARVLPEWGLVSAQEETEGWRPSGWQLIASDEHRLLYVLMQPQAHEGTQKEPATEVWVFDCKTKTRVRRMRLVRPGSSLAVTRDSPSLLLVQAGTRLDVYEIGTGVLIRSLGLPGFSTRLVIQPTG